MTFFSFLSPFLVPRLSFFCFWPQGNVNKQSALSHLLNAVIIQRIYSQVICNTGSTRRPQQPAARMNSSTRGELPGCQSPAENTLRVCDVLCCPIHAYPACELVQLAALCWLCSTSVLSSSWVLIPTWSDQSWRACTCLQWRTHGRGCCPIRLSHLLLMSREWERWCHLWADSSHYEAVEGRESMGVEESSAISQNRQITELVYPGCLKQDVSLCAKKATVSLVYCSLSFAIFL